MSQIATEILGSPAESENPWLAELMQLLQWNNEPRAHRALRAVLHALRDRLTPDAASIFGDQFPPGVRCVFYEDYHPAGKPVLERRTDDFLGQVAAELRDCTDDLHCLTRAVLKVLASHVPATELDSVLANMPKGIRDLLDDHSPPGRSACMDS